MRRPIELEVGDKIFKVTEWERTAIVLVAQGTQLSSIAAQTGVSVSAATMRISRLSNAIEIKFGITRAPQSSRVPLICLLAYSAGLVRLL